MKWLLDFLPRLLLGMLIFCLMIVMGLINPSAAQTPSAPYSAARLCCLAVICDCTPESQMPVHT